MALIMMVKRFFSRPLAPLLPIAAALMMVPVAQAQEPVFQGAHQDWRVFTRGEGEERVCYALATPSDSLPSNVDHGQVFFLVASWANQAAEEQPSFLAGYPLRPASPPRARVGSSRYTMFVSGSEGFLEDLDDESRLVNDMRRGASLRIDAVSERGTATVYEFSLSGITAALREVGQLC